MRRHRDNIFNRVMNGYMRRAAERALRCDLAFNAADTAVLLVACQNDLFTPDGRGNDLTAGPEAAASVVLTLARLLDTARGRGWDVVYAPQAGLADRVGDKPLPLVPILSRMREQGLFEAGSWGAEIHERLAPAAGDDVRPPYAGLSAFAGTGLAGHLRAAGVARVVVVGALADVQVDSTARDAVENGFQSLFLKSSGGDFRRHTWSLAPSDPSHHEPTSGQLHPGHRTCHSPLYVLGKTTAASHPREGSLHYPTT